MLRNKLHNFVSKLDKLLTRLNRSSPSDSVKREFAKHQEIQRLRDCKPKKE